MMISWSVLNFITDCKFWPRSIQVIPKNSFLVDKSVLKPCMAPYYQHGPHLVESIMVVMVGVGVTMTRASTSMREENYKKSLTVIFVHALIR